MQITITYSIASHIEIGLPVWHFENGRRISGAFFLLVLLVAVLRRSNLRLLHGRLSEIVPELDFPKESLRVGSLVRSNATGGAILLGENRVAAGRQHRKLGNHFC